jgi:hypothetical protein
MNEGQMVYLALYKRYFTNVRLPLWTRFPSSAAYAQVRTARALDNEPHLTAGAPRRGEIDARHVEVIRRAMEQVEKTCLNARFRTPARGSPSSWAAQAWMAGDRRM